MSEAFLRDFPTAPHFMRYQISSLSRKQVESARGLLNQRRVGGKNSSRFNLSSAEFSSYIEARKVPCLTPAIFMRTADVEPSRVDVLVVDAEGFDAHIVQSFLAVPAFQPKAIVFEWVHIKQSDRRPLLANLTAKGYTTNCTEIDYLFNRLDFVWKQCPMNAFFFLKP